jgi:uncharacterized membrane protein
MAGAFAASLLTFIVFAFSITLLAVQIASGQLTPRVISRVLEGRLAKVTLGVFLFSYAHTLAPLGRIEDHAPQLPLLVAFVSSQVSVLLFLYLIQQTGSSLRAGVILAGIAADTSPVIRSIYPNRFSPLKEEDLRPGYRSTPMRSTILHTGRSGTLVTIDAVTLMTIAEHASWMIELVPPIGDFLGTGDDLFQLRAEGAAPHNHSEPVDDIGLSRCIALGPEQTIEKHPAFRFRILFEIGLRVLSPPGDRTNCVLAIDQLHHLLLLLSQKQLDAGIVRDTSGYARLIYRVFSWEDFVAHPVTELRPDGGDSPQITRRLQAIFEHLIEVVPAERAVMLRSETEMLRQAVDRSSTDSEDRVLAAIATWRVLAERHVCPRFPGVPEKTWQAIRGEIKCTLLNSLTDPLSAEGCCK